MPDKPCMKTVMSQSRRCSHKFYICAYIGESYICAPINADTVGQALFGEDFGICIYAEGYYCKLFMYF